MAIQFHPDVSCEVKASYVWYQHQVEGLGDDFIYELESAYQAIIELPRTWPKFQNHFRRFLLSRFPFSVIYRIHDDDLLYVVAVMHNSRKTEYWLDRV